MKRGAITFILCLSLFQTEMIHAESEETKREEVRNFLSSVLDISKENTYPNTPSMKEQVKPNELTKELLEDAKVQINNPQLIKMLNETDLQPSPLAIGYRGMIYMGEWPLNYETKEQSINWQYQKINTNQKDNQDGYESKNIHYSQEKERAVRGALTEKVDYPNQIKEMMLFEAQKRAELPLAFDTVIGEGTDMNLSYGVPSKKVGILEAYAPAVHEQGKVTFGEVYLKLKGSKTKIVIQNVETKDVGAWIPVQDRLSITFRAQ
ncbi:hypothetical protein GS400_02910 [Pontibacillus sp. HMF3514]|nr:hypothetical protein GS400_02910 [Pontibacillus sp. HMF3514]